MIQVFSDQRGKDYGDDEDLGVRHQTMQLYWRNQPHYRCTTGPRTAGVMRSKTNLVCGGSKVGTVYWGTIKNMQKAKRNFLLFATR